MRANIEQNNDFAMRLRILFNGENNATIIAASAGLKTVKLAAQFVGAQARSKLIFGVRTNDLMRLALATIDAMPQ